MLPHVTGFPDDAIKELTSYELGDGSWGLSGYAVSSSSSISVRWNLRMQGKHSTHVFDPGFPVLGYLQILLWQVRFELLLPGEVSSRSSRATDSERPGTFPLTDGFDQVQVCDRRLPAFSLRLLPGGGVAYRIRSFGFMTGIQLLDRKNGHGH